MNITKPKIIIGAIVAFVALILLLIVNPFHSVPTGSRGVITQFGAIKGIASEGMALLPPWQSMTLFSIRAERADIKNAEGSTSDQQPVFTSLTVRYSISPNKVSEVYEQYSHDGDLSSYVQTAAQEVMKSVTARYTAPELIAKRQQVSSDIMTGMRKKLDLYGAQVINIDMTNFQFGKDYMAAINEKVTQEQKRLVAENQLKTVEAQQKQKVAIAEADAAAARAQADGQAYSNLKIAEAQAKALKIQADALAQSKDVLELRRIEVEKVKAERWDGKLPQNMYAGAPIPFLNMGK
jgi:regulator of protease activity HflC (stomatin/prohibitin superfamily)